MPASYSIDSSRALILSRAWGILTDEDVREHYRLLLSDAAFDPAFRQLADVRDVTRVEVSPTTVRDAGLLRVFVPGTRRAIVVGTALLSAIARMFAIYCRLSQNGRVEVFSEFEEAERWLGIGGDVADGASGIRPAE